MKRLVVALVVAGPTLLGYETNEQKNDGGIAGPIADSVGILPPFRTGSSRVNPVDPRVRP